jgi:hypothetical protein
MWGYGDLEILGTGDFVIWENKRRCKHWDPVVWGVGHLFFSPMMLFGLLQRVSVETDPF